MQAGQRIQGTRSGCIRGRTRLAKHTTAHKTPRFRPVTPRWQKNYAAGSNHGSALLALLSTAANGRRAGPGRAQAPIPDAADAAARHVRLHHRRLQERGLRRPPRQGVAHPRPRAASRNPRRRSRAIVAAPQVKSEQEASDIAARLASGETTFGDAARSFSTCPSAKSGGSLGSFEPGKMVKEFDAVCFDEAVPVGECVGPIKTQFGWHLVVVQERFTNQERSEGSSVF